MFEPIKLDFLSEPLQVLRHGGQSQVAFGYVYRNKSGISEINFDELKAAENMVPLNRETHYAACVDLLKKRVSHLPQLLHSEFRTGQGQIPL